MNIRKLQRSNIIFDISNVLFAPKFDSVSAHIAFAPIEPGIALLRQCAAQRDETGARTHKLFILSNLGLPLLEQLTNTFPDIITLFDGILVSGMVNIKKPDPAIFIHLLSKYGLIANTCIFIDDAQENVTAATSVGITGIVCADYGVVERELQKLNAL